MSAKPGRPAKGYKGRQRKLVCPGCGFICYASAGAVVRAGLPYCGCGRVLVVANLRDIAVIEPESVEPEALAHLPERSYNAFMRELGYTDMIVTKQRPRRSRQPQCSHAGCSRFKRAGEKFCAGHLEAMPF